MSEQAPDDLLPDLSDDEQAEQQSGDPELREAEDSEESDEGHI